MLDLNITFKLKITKMIRFATAKWVYSIFTYEIFELRKSGLQKKK